MTTLRALAGLALAVTASAVAQSPERPWQHDDGRIEFQDRTFDSWRAYHASDLVDPMAKCGAPTSAAEDDANPTGQFRGFDPGDCSYTSTTINSAYDPAAARLEIRCVVHVIMNDTGTLGHLSEAAVESGIRILNEDFNALAGTPGATGTFGNIDFVLATEDPDGNPTNGITYSQNTTWYNDQGFYWYYLAWDPNTYLNIYTNTAGGYLGYVWDFPSTPGYPGSPEDRVVVLWEVYGDDAPYGPPYNLGRTLTHEVGHYCGLFHTFSNGCGSSDCYSSGDRICDTNAENYANFSCDGPPPSTCGSLDPIENYMNYTADICMSEFTPEQMNRARCSLFNFRPLVYSEGPGCSSGCFGDITDDGQVDSADIGLLISAWGICSNDPKFPCCADLNTDGQVDSADIGLMIGAWGGCPVDPCADVDCDDGDPCTIDTCVDGQCFHDEIPGCDQGPCGDPKAGSCFANNGTPGCDDQVCCELICAADPYCCETEWDDLCATDANADCKGRDGGADCCFPNGSPGCGDPTCQDAVCAVDPYCCQNVWDSICVLLAEQYCSEVCP